jgi:DNA polymerase III subunit chi
MLDVEFHTGVIDPVVFAVRLLRKAYRRDVRVMVTALEPELSRLDRLLWTDDDHDFLAHARVSQMSAAMATRTPLWLATDHNEPAAQAQALEASQWPQVLVNLGAPAPAEPRSLKRLIEVVGADPEQAARGRERWRVYKQLGLEIQHHAAVNNPQMATVQGAHD